MPKTLLLKELVFLDFRRNAFKFYDVEVLSVGYNDIQVLFKYGKLGNSGTQKVNRIQNENAYKEAMKMAYKKIYNKKSEGFISVEKMEKGLKHAIREEEKERYRGNSNKQQDHNKNHKCDICGTPINQKLYDKINAWGRNEGNWDYSQMSPLYGKVVCLDCQIEQDIFQKKIDETTEITFK